MEPTIKDVLDAIDDLRFDVEDIKEEMADVRMLIQELLDKLSEAKE